VLGVSLKFLTESDNHWFLFLKTKKLKIKESLILIISKTLKVLGSPKVMKEGGGQPFSHNVILSQ
jgi:hypothetical protein